MGYKYEGYFEIIDSMKTYYKATMDIKGRLFLNNRTLHNYAVLDNSALSYLYAAEKHRVLYRTLNGYKYEGYFEIIDSMKTYYKATMDIKNRDICREVFSLKKPIYTKVRDVAPAKYGIDCSVKDSLIADGCIIEGTVENSVLFRGVKVGKGAVIKNSIL